MAMKAGETVAAFERAFAEYVGAKYAIALANGTCTLHTALVALGVKPGDRVAVPPLTMSATTIAVLHAGAVPVFVDVDPRKWLMDGGKCPLVFPSAFVPVSLYGLHQPHDGVGVIDDAAQTLRPHSGAAFTSYSFQSSKILALGEGGMLCTNDEELAIRAREFSSLGYRMKADQPRIDPDMLKSPTFERHHTLGWNYRMSDLVAAEGYEQMNDANWLLSDRAKAASMYRQAISCCDWLIPQHVPEGWGHDYWTYAVALGLWQPGVVWKYFAAAIQKHGGERPYAAWMLTYQEPAFRHLAPDGTCPVAEDLQPRLVQLQTNNLESAEKNANALRLAIRELGG